MTPLAGKTILLTGATRGIGRAIALRLAEEGVRFALCGRDGKAMEEVTAEVRNRTGAPLHSSTFDLCDADAILGFYRGARKAVGPPDILINNAGFNSRKALMHEVGTNEFDSILGVNLRAPFIFMRESFHDMKERGEGHIINILSTVCHSSNETMSAYTAAKAGLRALTDVFRKEARPHNVCVSSIYPGGTDTTFRPKAREDYMKPESVAEAVRAVLTLPGDLVVHDFTFRPMVEANF